MGFWENKVVIITGSSIGIGKNMAMQIIAAGGKVALNARNETRLQETVSALQTEHNSAIGISGDISIYEDCEMIVLKSIAAFGKVDVLINNAGLASQTNIATVNPAVFQSIFNVNVMGSVFMTKACLPELTKQKGAVLFMGSVAGIYGIGGYAAYSASKMSLKAITEALRIELHDTHIHIALAYVGFTENDPQKTFLDADGKAVSLPNRSNVKQEPVEIVAKRLLNMVEKRKKMSVFSSIGKITAFISKTAPWVLHKVLLKNYKKHN